MSTAIARFDPSPYTAVVDRSTAATLRASLGRAAQLARSDAAQKARQAVSLRAEADRLPETPLTQEAAAALRDEAARLAEDAQVRIGWAAGIEAKVVSMGQDLARDTSKAASQPGRAVAAAADALVAAYRRGHTIEHEFTDGQNSGVVRMVRLADGTEAVYKRTHPSGSENPTEVADAYLAGLVAQAVGIEHTAAAILSDTELLCAFAPGVSCSEQLRRAGEHAVETMPEPSVERRQRMYVERDVRTEASHAEFRRVLSARNSREIGLLDYLVDNYDRNDNNILVDGETVYPIDHSYACFGQGNPDQDGTMDLHSPFARRHLTVERPSCEDRHERLPPPVTPAQLVSPFTADELAEYRARLGTLRPRFEAQQALAKWQFMMKRLALIEAVAT